MELNLELSIFSLLFCFVPLFFLFRIKSKQITQSTNIFSSPKSSNNKIPKSYPIIGSYLSTWANKDCRNEWLTGILLCTPNLTFTLFDPLNFRTIITANPSIVQHILKTNFDSVYQKGDFGKSMMAAIFGNGILNADADLWKYQRHVSSHIFNSKALRNYIETVVNTNLSERLIPFLTKAAANKTVVDFQDILLRFIFDNMCKYCLGYDPGYLLPPYPEAKFATALQDAVNICVERFLHPFPLMWKIKRVLDIGSEKKLRLAVEHVREFVKEIVREKRRTLPSSLDDGLLSRFLINKPAEQCMESELDELNTDIMLTYLSAGRDSVAAGLTSFFWLLAKHPEVEEKILEEIGENESVMGFDEVKNNMMYTHASLYETIRLYPPVAEDFKEALKDDILPDGTFVKKGTRVAYHPYAMGRVEKVWGKDCAEFKPERWLEMDETTGKLTFVSSKVDSYTYTAFQAGPRTCLGKEMAFLQMKSVVAAILRRFKVVPVMKQGVEPVLIQHLTYKMKGGFPVTFQEREQKNISFIKAYPFAE